jgi:hypothetical protein
MEYLYDDCGVICRKNPEDETDIQPVEPHCLNCGSPTLECDCGDYEAGWYIDEEKEKIEREKIDRGIIINPNPTYPQTAER